MKEMSPAEQRLFHNELNIPIPTYKLGVMPNIQKTVFALYVDLYYYLIVQNTLNYKELFMHLNENFINVSL